MDDVAEEAGLQRSNLYRYFANRDALIAAVIVREIEITNVLRRQKIPLSGPVSAVLVESLELGYDIARTDETTQLLLTAEARDATSMIVAAQQAIMNAERDYWDPVLAYGRARDEINPSMSDARIVRWFLTAQVLLSTRAGVPESLAAGTRDFFTDFVVPPVLNLIARG